MSVLVVCFLLVSASAYSQTQIPVEPPVFDKKLWTVTSVLIGSSILTAELTARENQNYQPERRLKIYTVAGISDFLIIAMSANLKSDGKKWWWVPAIATSVVNGGFAVKYRKSF
jgi:hypothetical protein